MRDFVREQGLIVLVITLLVLLIVMNATTIGTIEEMTAPLVRTNDKAMYQVIGAEISKRIATESEEFWKAQALEAHNQLVEQADTIAIMTQEETNYIVQRTSLLLRIEELSKLVYPEEISE